MSEEVSEQQEEQVSEAAPKATRQPKVKKPRFLVCSDKVRGGLYDTERNLRIPSAGMNPVQVEGNIREGSWLDCQIKAGLVTVM